MNEMANNELGGLHSAKILMHSIEFGDFSKQERLAEKGNWKPLNETMIDAAQRLKNGGADFIVIASNTMNSRADDIQATVKIPVLHIADATGTKVKERGIENVALLGTKFTMEQNFYRERLEKTYGLHVIIPNETERDYINRVIFDELCANKITSKSRELFKQIINRLVNEEGAQGMSALRVVPGAYIFSQASSNEFDRVGFRRLYAILKGDSNRDTYILAWAHMRLLHVNANWNDDDCRGGCSAGQGA